MSDVGARTEKQVDALRTKNDQIATLTRENAALREALARSTAEARLWQQRCEMERRTKVAILRLT